MGAAIGEAYQVADDLRDALGAAAAGGAALGKPTGRDEAKDRPSAVRAHGVEEARALLRAHAQRAIAAIPRLDGDGAPGAPPEQGPRPSGRDALAQFLEALARRFGA